MEFQIEADNFTAPPSSSSSSQTGFLVDLPLDAQHDRRVPGIETRDAVIHAHRLGERVDVLILAGGDQRLETEEKYNETETPMNRSGPKQ